jgi:hypothetical protein
VLLEPRISPTPSLIAILPVSPCAKAGMALDRGDIHDKCMSLLKMSLLLVIFGEQT